jgi:hypothetical protein
MLKLVSNWIPSLLAGKGMFFLLLGFCATADAYDCNGTCRSGCQVNTQGSACSHAGCSTLENCANTQCTFHPAEGDDNACCDCD